MTSIFAPTGVRPVRNTPAARLADASVRQRSLSAIIAAWDDRRFLRQELRQMSRDNPHLIDDIGLTRRQIEAEIAKPFWQA